MDSWEFLSSRRWTIGEVASDNIQMITNAERIAKSAAEMVLAGSTHEMASVALMVDIDGMSLVDVATEPGTSPKVVSRAFKQSKLEQTVSLAKQGRRHPIHTRLRLPADVHVRIRELVIADGMSYRQIAREVGCDHHAASNAN